MNRQATSKEQNSDEKKPINTANSASINGSLYSELKTIELTQYTSNADKAQPAITVTKLITSTVSHLFCNFSFLYRIPDTKPVRPAGIKPNT